MHGIQEQKTKAIEHAVNYLSGDSSFIIDLVRVIACEMVVFCHVFLIYDNYYRLPLNNTNIFFEIDSFLGDTGVVLFFIVSGIVISNSLFKNLENKIYGFKAYFIDRFSRIYMGLIPCLAFIFLCDMILLAINPGYFHMLDKRGTDLMSFLGSLLMLQNIELSGVTTPAYGGNLWTLNIEWWLYMMFGWIAINIVRKRRLGLLFLIPLAIFSYYPLHEFLMPGHPNLVLIWYIGVGATLLYLYGSKIEAGRGLNIALCALGFLALSRIGILYLSNAPSYYDITLEILIALIVVSLMVKYKSSRLFEKTWIKGLIKFMGKYSYTLYLIHLVIEVLVFGVYITWGLQYPIAMVFIVSIALSNLVAICIALPTEMQYKKLARFLKARLT